MDAIQADYNALLAAVFKNAYDELVENIRKAERTKERIRTAPTVKMAEDSKQRLHAIQKHIEYVENWIMDVMPGWLDIAPDTFIRWAHEEAEK